jgi:hypothetical protein
VFASEEGRNFLLVKTAMIIEISNGTNELIYAIRRSRAGCRTSTGLEVVRLELMRLGSA